MSRRPGARPHGQIRQSQLITSFGRGSMMDLPNHSVLVGGLDSWSTGGDEIIEPRLVDKLKSLFDPPLLALKLYSPPPDNEDPTAPQTGITGWQFPEWFITQDVDIEAKDLFASYRMMKVEGLGEFEGYPNRNSLPYKEIYGIEDTDTILRGTFRYPGWSPTLKAIVDLDFLSEEAAIRLTTQMLHDNGVELYGLGES